MEKIYQTLFLIVGRQFEVDPQSVSKNTHFEKDLDADSIDLIMFVIEVENTYGVTIPKHLLSKISTPEIAAEIVKKRL